MNTRRMIVWALPIAVSASVACSHENAANGSAAPPGISPVASSVPAAPPAQPSAQAQAENPTWGERDPAGALLHATKDLSDTDSISLTSAQKTTLQDLHAKLEASRQSLGAAFESVHADIANQVRSGAIDSAKVHSDEATLDRALQSHMVQEADTLNGIHGVLAPEQRSDVVAAARAERPGVAERQANPGTSPEESTAEKQKDRLDRLTNELGLDSGQQQRVSSLIAAQPAEAPLRESRQWRAEHEDAMLNAFQSNDFDARTALGKASPKVTEAVHEGLERRTNFLSQLLPILRPDQRDKLASIIQTGPMAHNRAGD